MASTAQSGAIFRTSFLRRQQRPIILRYLPLANTQSLFGLISSTARGGRVTATMPIHKVKLITPEGEKEVNCPGDVFILDAAEEAGVFLPYSCRAGSCSSCAGKVVSGYIDQPYQTFLDDEQMDAGYVLTCVAYPTSDVVIETHKEEEII